MGWKCSAYGREDINIQDFGGETEGGRTVGRQRLRLEVIIKIDLQEVRRGMDWIDLAQDRDR
jgi:hypothetical protein